MEMQAEINALITNLRRLGGSIDRTIKSDLREGANLVVTAIKARTPVGSKPHSRYPYKGKRMKLPKGAGIVLATYRPGNLKRSFRILPLRRTKAALVVGANLKNTPDGYYAHMVNNKVTFANGKTRAGKKFVDAAIGSVGPLAQKVIIDALSYRISAANKTDSKNWASAYLNAKGR